MTDDQQPQAANDAREKPSPRRDWDGVAAIIAAFVGLLALGVSAYTAHIQWLQTSAQVWPHLMLVSSDSEIEHKLIVFNKGTGPALIQSVVIRLDGKPQRDWSSIFDAIDPDLKDADIALSTSGINGTTLSAGERYEYLAIEDKKGYADSTKVPDGGKSSATKIRSAAQAWKVAKPAMDRTETRICYCSVLKQCWVIGTGIKTTDHQGLEVDHCERKEDDEFRN